MTIITKINVFVIRITILSAYAFIPDPLQRERADCPAIPAIAADICGYDNVFPSTQSEP
ncbi:hypothetical protein [Enterobacter sichuanensis]|uniref:hypothetical protein n=1 Tax=Enterobacter sichuanensis TaxID=2071710 RepID=UPI0012FF0BF0|nr:hypothetical protein [Enterobacter sichuanensis]